MRVAAERRTLASLGDRPTLHAARGSPRGGVRGGIGVCFGCLIWGARAASRDAPRVPGQPRMRARGWGGGLSRVVVTWLLLCCSRRIVVDRGSQQTVPALARPSNSSQVYVSRFRRACLADRAPNNFFGRAKFELVLLNASSALRAKLAKCDQCSLSCEAGAQCIALNHGSAVRKFC